MNTDDFKIILEEALKPIKQQLDDPKTGLKIINKKLGDLDSIKGDLNSIKQRLDDPKTGLKKINEKLDAVWDQTAKLTIDMEEVKETLDSHTKVLDSHTKSLKRIEIKVEYNSDNVNKVDKRLIKVESHLGISAPPELSII